MKERVIQSLRDKLVSELEAEESVAAATRSEVGSDETKQEGKYDTRATEASYLARGQAWRVAELRRLVAWFAVFDPHQTPPRTIGPGSLVRLDGARAGWFLLGPVGGPSTEVEGVPIRLISPKSPLGQAMLGQETEDWFEVSTPAGMAECEVCEIM